MVGKFDKLLDNFDRLLNSFVIGMKGVHVLEVLNEHKFVLTKSLNGFNHVRLKVHARPNNFSFFKNLLKSGVILSEQFHDFIRLGVVIAVAGIASLKIFMYEELEDRS